MRPVTLQDVAKFAGVSVATASRVLSGHPSTSVDARTRVAEAATELGFRPNAQARALRKTRTESIGVVVSDIRNPFFAEIAHTAEQTAGGAGLAIILCNANESTQQQDRYIDLLIAHRADGIVIAPQGDGSGALREIVRLGIPTVFVDRTIDGFDVPSITSDSLGGIAQAVEHLVNLGHHRIGCIAGPQSTSTGRERLVAFSDAVKKHGADQDTALVYEGDFQVASGVAGARRLLDLACPPTALIAADSLMTLGALHVCQDRAISIPDELSIVGYDDIEAFRLIDPPVTVVAHDPARTGELAVELLTRMFDGETPESVVLDAHLVVRGSTGPAPLRRDVPAPAALELEAPSNVRDLPPPQLPVHPMHVDDVARLLS
ncbi:LacI family transcriptional regulator [Flavimobilis soli]|uniref:LacI family transcriptional regulator n=1 Tax=Flavimobilis soli TaxID=442709 RepID=A0A2A9EEN9_9MICO|nr:LacI family DNA-binding transcriptional regulator [Flavimobilis soli]PFG37011.1 LacI family transcriptional regulator [Flavimobilis soli]